MLRKERENGGYGGFRGRNGETIRLARGGIEESGALRRAELDEVYEAESGKKHAADIHGGRVRGGSGSNGADT